MIRLINGIPAVRALFRARDACRGRARHSLPKADRASKTVQDAAKKEATGARSKKPRAPKAAVPRRPTEGAALKEAAKHDVLVRPTATRRCITRTHAESDNDKYWDDAPSGPSFWGFAGKGRTVIAAVPGALGAFRFIRRHESDLEAAGYKKIKHRARNHLRFEFGGDKSKIPEDATFRDFLIVDIRLTRLAAGLYGEAKRWYSAYNGTTNKPAHSYHETLIAFGDRYFDRETRYTRIKGSSDAHVPCEPDIKPRRRRSQKKVGTTQKEEKAYNDAIEELFSDFTRL
jgi:hypothetical protein